MKVYDCFPFFNEFDLLEIRLQELWNSVDYFVLSESNLSHSGNPKNYFFLDNIERFKPYLDKIIRVDVNDMPETQDSWVRERYQRYSLQRGLVNSDPNDLIIVSDLDEIPRAEMIDLIKEDQNNYSRYLLNIPQFRHRINFMLTAPNHKYTNIIVTKKAVLTEPNQERTFTFPWTAKPNNSVVVEHGGWHFTWVGNDEEMKVKIKNYAHVEHNSELMLSSINIEKHLLEKKSFFNDDEKFEIVALDDYFPQYIVDNKDKFSSLILPDSDITVTDIYQE